jgi:hypothetical protein
LLLLKLIAGEDINHSKNEYGQTALYTPVHGKVLHKSLNSYLSSEPTRAPFCQPWVNDTQHCKSSSPPSYYHEGITTGACQWGWTVSDCGSSSRNNTTRNRDYQSVSFYSDFKYLYQHNMMKPQQLLPLASHALLKMKTCRMGYSDITMKTMIAMMNWQNTGNDEEKESKRPMTVVTEMTMMMIRNYHLMTENFQQPAAATKGKHHLQQRTALVVAIKSK